MKIDDINGSKVVRDDNPAIPQKYNQLAAFEMGSEANYNQIDGIVNNAAPKPSILEQMESYQKSITGNAAYPPDTRSHTAQER